MVNPVYLDWSDAEFEEYRLGLRSMSLHDLSQEHLRIFDGESPVPMTTAKELRDRLVSRISRERQQRDA